MSVQIAWTSYCFKGNSLKGVFFFFLFCLYCDRTESRHICDMCALNHWRAAQVAIGTDSKRVCCQLTVLQHIHSECSNPQKSSLKGCISKFILLKAPLLSNKTHFAWFLFLSASNAMSVAFFKMKCQFKIVQLRGGSTISSLWGQSPQRPPLDTKLQMT